MKNNYRESEANHRRRSSSNTKNGIAICVHNLNLLFSFASSHSLHSLGDKKIKREELPTFRSSSKQQENYHSGAREEKSSRKFMTNMSCEELFAIHYAYCCELFTYLILFEFPW